MPTAPDQPRCRRCDYDLTGLASPIASAAAPESRCPECAMPLSYNSGPLLHILEPSTVERLLRGCRAVGASADLLSGVALCVFLMCVTGAGQGVNPFSVPVLNMIIAVCAGLALIIAAIGSCQLIFRDRVRDQLVGRSFAFWAVALPVSIGALLLLPGNSLGLFVLPPVAAAIALPIATVRHVRRLGRLCGGDTMPDWAESASMLGSVLIASTYIFTVAVFASRPNDSAPALPALIACCTFQSFAWTFRLAARNIRAARNAPPPPAGGALIPLRPGGGGNA